MKIPQRWVEVLGALHRGGFPEAIIAGGALRDLDHGKPIKDVDIFVDAKSMTSEEIKVLLDKAFGYAGVGIFEDNSTADLDEDYVWEGVIVAGVWDWTYYEPEKMKLLVEGHGAPKFQVIAVENPDPETISFVDYVVEDFDIGLCKIAYRFPNAGGVPYVRYTADYATDRDNKTLTVLRAPSHEALARTRERLSRIQIKYPDHRIVVPEEFLAMEREFAAQEATPI